VSRWTDKSPFANNLTQSVAAQQPLVQSGALAGRATLRFSESSAATLTTGIFAPATMPALSVFAVHAERSDTGNEARLVSFYDAHGADDLTGAYLGLSDVPHAAFNFRDIAGRFPLGASQTGQNQRTGSTPLGTYVLEDEAISAGRVAAFFNGGLEGSQASTDGGPIVSNALRIASGYPGAPAAFADESIAEIVAYNRVLSDSERQTVEGYLACKWG
jgi:hypothetical protein